MYLEKKGEKGFIERTATKGHKGTTLSGQRHGQSSVTFVTYIPRFQKRAIPLKYMAHSTFTTARTNTGGKNRYYPFLAIHRDGLNHLKSHQRNSSVKMHAWAVSFPYGAFFLFFLWVCMNTVSRPS